MTVYPSPARKPRLDRVRSQALQLLATTASSWNLAGGHAPARTASAVAGSEPLRAAHAPHHSSAH